MHPEGDPPDRRRISPEQRRKVLHGTVSAVLDMRLVLSAVLGWYGHTAYRFVDAGAVIQLEFAWTAPVAEVIQLQELLGVFEAIRTAGSQIGFDARPYVTWRESPMSLRIAVFPDDVRRRLLELYSRP